MKKTILIISLITVGKVHSDSINSGELMITNLSENTTVTIYADVVWGAEWEDYKPLDEDSIPALFSMEYNDTSNSIYLEFHGESTDEDYGDGNPNNEIMGYGLYYLIINNENPIELDYRDCDYYGDNHLNYYSTGDVTLTYDSDTKTFESQNGNLYDEDNPFEIWTELKDPATQNTSLFIPDDPSNLTYSIVNHHPRFVFSASEPSEIISYTLFRDGSPIATNISGTIYTDLTVHIPGFNNYNYKVQANLSSPYNTNSENYSNTVLVRRAQINVKQIANESPDHFSITNYPNPFNPTTLISFDLPNRSNVQLTIYNILGIEKKSFGKEIFGPGNHTIFWDGKDNSGYSVSSGVYIYALKSENMENNHTIIKSGKMILGK